MLDLKVANVDILPLYPSILIIESESGNKNI